MCGVGDGPKVQATQQPALKRSSASGRPSYQRRLLQKVLLSLIWGITTGCLSYAPKGKLPAGVCLIIIGTEGYFLLATTSPLIQSWYARDRSSPYRLFALSNAASLIGLLAYPFLLEPWLTTLVQARLWSAGYTMFATCCGAAAIVSLRTPEKKSDAAIAASLELTPPPETIDVITWVALAALGSLGLVSVTTFIAANVASAPLIWIAPLTLYLVTLEWLERRPASRPHAASHKGAADPAADDAGKRVPGASCRIRDRGCARHQAN